MNIRPHDERLFGNLHTYYGHRARSIAKRENAPDALPDAGQWKAMRPVVREHFLRSLGLEHQPKPDNLSVTETGAFSGPGYTVRKLKYQLLPGCWGSAHLYRPADIPEDQTTPAVLYTCGHNWSGVIGYQHHPIGWARRGYTCLIFDTIQQHDNPGDHHGLNRGDTPGWIGRGYSAAGGEVFNGLCALEVLRSQPGVDVDRIGVTGISGGGSQSFVLAAIDEGIRAVATLCGVSTTDFAIPRRHVHSHCDCMYTRNIFAHDVSLFAALIAPRALLYCFARHDALFTPEEFRALHARTRARFEQLGCGEACALEEYDGPHGYNVRSTTDRIHEWFDRHVTGETHPDIDTLAIENESLPDESVLSVFHGAPPEPDHLNLLPELLSPRGRIALPVTADAWAQTRQQVSERLHHEVFHLLDDVEHPQTLSLMGSWVRKAKGGNEGCGREIWTGSLDSMDQYMMHLIPEDDYQAVVLSMGDRLSKGSDAAGRAWGLFRPLSVSTLGIEARSSGYAAFPEDHRAMLNREGCLVGLTPTMLLIQDLRHLVPTLKAVPSVQGRRIILHGRGEGAIAMLYHALLHPDDADIAGVILEDLPSSHDHTDFQIMSILRVLDLPQAVGLLAPTPTALINPEGSLNFDWNFVTRAHQRLGGHGLFASGDPREALRTILERDAER